MTDCASGELHLGIIMDGNGRWAKERSLSRIEGHRQGARVAKNIVSRVGDLGVTHLTLFGFSTENWRRPLEEVNALMTLFEQIFNDASGQFLDNDISFHFVGNKEGLPLSLVEVIEQTEKKTSHHKGMRLCLALNYGGRADIVHATKAIAKSIQDQQITIEDIDETLFASYLQNQATPYPDIILRTGGEMRISNFYLWQAAYSELFFTTTTWPNITIRDIEEVIKKYQTRERRYGDVL